MVRSCDEKSRETAKTELSGVGGSGGRPMKKRLNECDTRPIAGAQVNDAGDRAEVKRSRAPE